MSSLRTQRLSGTACLTLGLGLLIGTACSANNTSGAGGSSVRGTSGASNGSGGSTGSGATTGSGAINGNGATGNLNTMDPGDPDAGSCQHKELNFVPKTPTVFVLVDRSGSMFAAPNPPWEPLKTGTLQVIQELQADVAFGWGAFTGQNGGTCPDFQSVAPALNNYSAINAVYMPMGAVSYKAETPVGLALGKAEAALDASPADGDKYILFVTDGEPDFCDDGDSNCPLDDVVYHLQGLSAKGIHTIIFGLQNGNVPKETLQAFANAGSGQPVGFPFANAKTAQDVYYACQGVAGWKAEATAAGKTGMDILGTYATDAGGTAKYYTPDATDQNALTTELRGVLAGVKSCTFDLSDFTIDLTQLSKASVSVQDMTVPLDMTNGWTMPTSSELQLVGSACDNWKNPQVTKIDFNFPCEIVVPVK